MTTTETRCIHGENLAYGIKNSKSILKCEQDRGSWRPKTSSPRMSFSEAEMLRDTSMSSNLGDMTDSSGEQARGNNRCYKFRNRSYRQYTPQDGCKDHAGNNSNNREGHGQEPPVKKAYQQKRK